MPICFSFKLYTYIKFINQKSTIQSNSFNLIDKHNCLMSNSSPTTLSSTRLHAKYPYMIQIQHQHQQNGIENGPPLWIGNCLKQFSLSSFIRNENWKGLQNTPFLIKWVESKGREWEQSANADRALKIILLAARMVLISRVFRMENVDARNRLLKRSLYNLLRVS